MSSNKQIDRGENTTFLAEITVILTENVFGVS